ncbi:MAG: 5'-nucleotidase C-terminal domain-containing protein [FCB group bacterium]|jgi:5'-nucleotidase
MKTLFTLFAVALLFCSITLSALDKVTIIHVNDTHSNLAPGGSRDNNLQGKFGGIARAASVIYGAKQQDSNAIVLHAGDVSIGDLFFNKYFGVAEYELMQQLGFDAMTLGNHEFDLTASTLDTSIGTARASGVTFPFLSANMVLLNASLKNLAQVKKYILKKSGNVTVGIFGLTTPETNLTSQCLPDVFIDTNFVQIAGEMVQTLRATEKCDVVILLSHLGEYYDNLLLSYVPGIDLVVGGHDHYNMTKPVFSMNPNGDSIPIVQVGANYRNVGITTLNIDNGKVSLDKFQNVVLDESIPELPQVKGVVDGLIQDIESTWGNVYTKKLADCLGELDEVADPVNGKYNTGAGTLICNAFKDYTKTDIAIEPGGSIAQKLYEGPIVQADIYRMIGYGFNTDNHLGYRLDTFQIYGQALIGGLEIGTANVEINDDFFIQCLGMSYKIDITKPVGSRVSEVMIGGTTIDPTQKYSVTTNEFVPMVLKAYGIPFENEHVFTGLSEYEVVLNYIKKNPVITLGSVIIDVNEKSSGEKETNASYVVSPNPCNEQAFINFNLSNNGNYSLSIINSLGQIISNVNLGYLSSGNNQYNIDTKNYSLGSYNFRITNGMNSINGRFLIIR